MDHQRDDHQEAYAYTIDHYARTTRPAQTPPPHAHSHRPLNLGLAVLALLLATLLTYNLLSSSGNVTAQAAIASTSTPVAAVAPAGATGLAAASSPAEAAVPLTIANPPTLAEEEAALTNLYTQSSPAVVKIFVSTFGRLDLEQIERRAGGTGSGFFIDAAGRVLTNQHVIADADDVAVQLAGGEIMRAEIIGEDTATDLAVIQVDLPPAAITPVQFANSDALRVGQVVVAIGHPFGLDSTLTVGHVSGLGRMTISNDIYMPFLNGLIQTDAAINPGNSGGALFDLQGNVVGITTAIISTSQGSQGIGLAVDSNTAQQVVADLVTQGYVSRPFLGVAGIPLNRDIANALDLRIDSGLLLQQIAPRSPAAAAGLSSGDEVRRLGRFRVRADGDILTAVNNRPVDSLETYTQLLQESVIGETVTLTVFRDGREIEVQATLSDGPIQ